MVAKASPDHALFEGLTRALREAMAGSNEAIAQTTGALREVREGARILIEDGDKRVLALRLELDSKCRELQIEKDKSTDRDVRFKALENEKARVELMFKQLGDGLDIVKKIGLVVASNHAAQKELGGGNGGATVSKIPPIEAEIDALLSKDLSAETLRLIYEEAKPALLPLLASQSFLAPLIVLVNNEKVTAALKKDLGEPAWAVRLQKIARAAGLIK